MHHVALDRAWAHDRNLDDEVVEARWLEPRQHRHLRTAFDLEHADRVGALDHRIDARLLGGNGRQGQPLAVMFVEKLEALAQRRQHAERQHVDLEKAERVKIVLVPFDHRALFHRRIHHRRDFVEPVAGDDEAAAVLGQMARKADQRLRHLERHLERRIGGIEPDCTHMVSSIGAVSWPQAVPLRAAMISSERPKTLAVSRIAERVR